MRPQKIKPSHEVVSQFGSTADRLYAVARVDKTSRKAGVLHPRLLAVNAEFVMLTDPKTKQLKCFWEFEDIRQISLAPEKSQMLIQSRNDGERDQLLTLVPHNMNSHDSVVKIAEIIRSVSVAKARGHHNAIPIQTPGVPLDQIGNLYGSKPDPKKKLQGIRNRSRSPVARSQSIPPSAPTPMAPDAHSGKAQSEGGHSPTFDDVPVEDMQESPSMAALQPTRPLPAGHQDYSRMNDGSEDEEYVSPRWVPGYWRKGQRTSGGGDWELYPSRTHEGKCYWYNRRTGDCTWEEPEEARPPSPRSSGGQSPQPGRRTRAPWVPASPVSAHTPRLLTPRPPPRMSLPDEIREEMGIPQSPPDSPRTLGQYVFPTRSPALVVLEHAAMCSGMDVDTLMSAAASVSRTPGSVTPRYQATGNDGLGRRRMESSVIAV
eukprot:Sspe_Gene.17691::Locus_6294_Transcript_1_1_Confidence_1.000_Length_1507::g.17691::m.17691